jgi:HEAT repeat protein
MIADEAWIAHVKTKMTRRLFTALVFTGVVAALFAWPFLRMANQPRYQGKTLDYWFLEYCSANNRMGNDWSRNQMADKALREIGTNAVPYLLKIALLKPESKAKTAFISIINGIHFVPHQPLVSSDVEREEAESILREIKVLANQLLPLLDKLLKSKTDLDRRQALYFLGSTGDGAELVLPYLESALRSSNYFERVLASQSLSQIGPPAGPAAPALIELLGEPMGTNHLPLRAAIALGKIGGSMAAPAIPVVKELFEKTTNWDAQCSLAGALFRMDATQKEALEFLMDGVTNHQPASWAAVSVLADIGPSASNAVPALMTVLGWATNDEDARVFMAQEVLEIDPVNHEAHLVLMEAIQIKPASEELAIDTLGRAGPAAKEALPILREATQSLNGSAKEMALWAIREIEAKPDEQ